MKKTMIAITVLSAFVCLTGCGTDITANVSQNALPAPTSQAAETTISAVQTAVSGAQTSGSAAASATVSSSAALTSTTAQTEAAKIVLDESKRLFGGYVATKDNSTLNLRSQPNTGSAVLAQIPNATQLSIYACDAKGWYLTSFSGKNGYVSAEFIKEIESHNADAEKKTTAMKATDMIGAWNYVNASGDTLSAFTVGEDCSYGEIRNTNSSMTDARNGNVQIVTEGETEYVDFYDAANNTHLRFTPDPRNPKEYLEEKGTGRLINVTGFAKPNADGFYDTADLPASSVSVSALSGTWNQMSFTQPAETIGKLTITAGSDIYHGTYEYTDADGKTVSGKVQIQYLLGITNFREYCYTFYQDNGTFTFALNVEGSVPCNDLTGYQSGDPHFVRAE